jgi:hypothetical protein
MPEIDEIALTSPVGGETWLTGSSYNITWSLAGDEVIDIFLTRDNGKSWTLLFGSVFNTGTKAWTVTEPPTTTARIRVEVQGTQPQNFDVSPLPFIIKSNPTKDFPYLDFTAHLYYRRPNESSFTPGHMDDLHVLSTRIDMAVDDFKTIHVDISSRRASLEFSINSGIFRQGTEFIVAIMLGSGIFGLYKGILHENVEVTEKSIGTPIIPLDIKGMTSIANINANVSVNNEKVSRFLPLVLSDIERYDGDKILKIACSKDIKARLTYDPSKKVLDTVRDALSSSSQDEHYIEDDKIVYARNMLTNPSFSVYTSLRIVNFDTTKTAHFPISISDIMEGSVKILEPKRSALLYKSGPAYKSKVFANFLQHYNHFQEDSSLPRNDAILKVLKNLLMHPVVELVTAKPINLTLGQYTSLDLSELGYKKDAFLVSRSIDLTTTSFTQKFTFNNKLPTLKQQLKKMLNL